MRQSSTGSGRKPRIALVYVTPISNYVTGLSSYAEAVFGHLLKNGGSREFVLFTNADRNIFGGTASAGSLEWHALPQCPRGIPYIFYELYVHQHAMARARKEGCTIYLSATSKGALFPILKQIFTMHDLYDASFAYRNWHSVLYSRLLWWWLSLVSWRIVCVSRATANGMRELFHMAHSKIAVIREASKYPIQVGNPQLPPRFLYVANVELTKNTECLLEAIRLAGGELQVDWIGRDVSGFVKRWVAAHGTPVGLVPHGAVTNDELCGAYRKAWALVVASWAEGFCLPILEAHAFGVPVIASDIPILHEVAGDGALYFDPHDPAALSETMCRLAGDPGLRRRLSAAAVDNAAKFSWDEAATELLALMLSSQASV